MTLASARRTATWILGVTLSAAVGAAAPRPSPPSLVLLTLDTTRADYLGSYGARLALTSNLDALAARGTRYARGLSPSPLTLPAHCTLLTGQDPPGHGVHDNGTAALPAGLPTLATALSARGYTTAAFLSSRVLDRRFGLHRGFATYDDRMPAERTGEYGYPERDAEAVTTAALAWVAARPAGRPYFLWVHYYDPHAPYAAPGDWSGADAARRYAGEIAHMDRQVGRLLAALPGDATRTLIAAVGDHGEMLGEHGEDRHGIFLYRASLEVPLILAGPGVPAGGVVPQTVGIRALPATLLKLLGLGEEARAFGGALPGLPISAKTGTGEPVYSETFLPATAYGWSPLKAVSDERLRLVSAPKPELYDFVADPAEQRNLLGSRPQDRKRLERVLAEIEGRAGRTAAPVAPDPEIVESLARLGYISASSGSRGSQIDPKDGIAMLAELEQAKQWLREGRHEEALARIEDLVRRSPGNVPFLVRLAVAQSAVGRTEASLATLKHTVGLNPRLDFLHVHLADAYFEAGRLREARAAYEEALKLNPRFARAWLALGEIALRTGEPGEELRLLRRATAEGTDSAALWARLAQLELAARDFAAAEGDAQQATRLVPEFAAAWIVWGAAAERSGRLEDAVARYEKAVSLAPSDPTALLHLGRALRAAGQEAAARRHLERAAAQAGTAAGREARRLLEARP